MQNNLILRGYQDESLDGLRQGFAAGHRSQMLYLPTGGGKTEVAISMLAAAADKGHRAAMVMDRRVLCDQTSQRLEKYNIDHGVLMAGHWRYQTHKSIQICSAQTLEKRGSFPNLKLLIVDEAHNTRAQTAEFIKNNPSIKVVGLSASPFTRGLGGIYSNVVSTTTTEALVNAGSLAPLRVFICKEIDMTGAKKVGGEWSSADAGQRGIRITGDIVSEWIKKTFEMFGGPRKTIAFSANVAHGQDLAEKFKQAGFNFVSISYKDDEATKAAIFAEFAKPDSTIHGLIATDILTKGFDCPDVMIGISARPFTKSFSSHVQQLGRTMRSFPGKDFALWIDHSGNFLRFKDDWEALYYNGVHELDDGAEKPKREPTKEEKEAAKCHKCGELWGPKDVCQHCGAIRIRRNAVIAVAGAMEEIKIGKTVFDGNKTDLWNQICTIVKARGNKPGRAFHLYQDLTGRKPPKRFEDAIDVPVSSIIKNEIMRRNIAFAKGRSA
ncbi:DEAD/DEAH box helicase family protein [Methylomonas sp. Kb3]|uniref:DEAD/DEAH box helicase n=1 Tax=Methylomonas sp. Kb3 TaxID=1611544 RepID=UPI0013FD3244|nr:DEAD/DEAH box helicase family protein [Methylomonas sp. Kb3]